MQNIQAMDSKRFVTLLCVMILFVLSSSTMSSDSSTMSSVSSSESTPTSLSASNADSSTPAKETTQAVTTQSSGELELGGNCSDSNTPCKNGTNCDDGICKISVGGNCTNYKDNCTKGAVCEDYICKLELGENCVGDKETLCKNGTTCDNEICKISLGGNCTNYQGNCTNGTVCEDNICKISIGGNCTKGNCTKGAVCEVDICKLELGENCTGANLTLCKNGTTCDNEICKISVGGDCTTYGGNCTNGTVCEDNICRIIINGNCSGSNEGYCRNDTKCDKDKCKVIYGKNCSSSTDACEHSLNCTSVENTKLCLCPDKQFRYNDSCETVTKLNVNFSQDSNSYKENEVSVNWKRPPNFTNLSITYCVNISPNESYTCINNTSITFSTRTPGTMYLINITTRVPKDSSLTSEYEETVSESKQFYTKPAKPGNLTQSDYSGPDVDLQFTPSNGRVQLYVITVSSNTYTYTNSSSSPSVSITGLTEGTDYTFTAFARITRNDTTENIDSDNLTTKFHVKASKSDPVKDLNIEGNSSRWAVISWLRPDIPRGEIIGYVLYAESNGTCVFAFLSICTNCSGNFTESKTCNRTESKNYTREEFQNEQKFTVNATELKPAVTYTMTVFAHNIAGEGKPNNKTIKTDEEAAQDISSLKISALDEKMLNVTWTPGEYTGDTTYFVTWAEETSLGSSNYSQKNNTNISGYDNVSLTIRGLLSFWNYNVTVQAFTAKGFSPNATSAIYRTKDSQPGEVKDFEIIQPEKSAETLDLIVQCPDERNRNGIITSYSVIYSIIGTENSSRNVSWPSDPNCSSNVTNSIDVTAEKNYSISVSANTVIHNGILKNKTKYIDPKETIYPEPELTKPPDGFPDFVAFDKANTNNTDVSVVVQLCTCLVNENRGAIILAGIIICKMVDLKDCEPERGKHIEDYNMTNLTWAYYNKNPNTKRYRTTPDTFHLTVKSPARRRRRSLSDPLVMNYAVGSNNSCDSTHLNEFCNGRLTPSSKYKAIAFACTRGGCSENEGIEIETKASPTTDPVGAIVGGIFGALAVIAIIVLVLFLYRRYQRKDDFVEIDAPHKTIVRKPVKLKHFAEHLERLHRDSNLLFQEEFEEVQENSPKNYSTDAATLDANKVKNRYVNILSFDHTRVKLITDDGDPSTDFINANYIPGYSSPREYIATQGPMVSTVADMWRMMWEQNSSIIVMLSDLTEKGRPKVDMYWPNELNSPVQYGNVIVDMTACSTLNTYTIRNFTISMENGNEKRRVTQYFFPGWEDYGANVSPEDLLDFVKAVRQEATSKPDHGPITVHCSAGVGRTGTFIALDFLMQFVNDNSLDAEVDIYNLVLNMRHHRPMMVQSEKQYIFVHDALKLIIENKIKAMKEQNEDNIYQNTTSDNIYANQAFEPEDENLYENTNKLGQPTTTL